MRDVVFCIIIILTFGCDQYNEENFSNNGTTPSSIYMDSGQIIETNIQKIEFMDENAEVHSLDNILKHRGTVLVLFYTYSSCWACVSDYLRIFNKIGSRYPNQVIVIVNQEQLRSLRVRKNQNENLSFFQPIDDTLYIGKYFLTDSEPAMCLINGNAEVFDFRLGLAIDSIGNLYFKTAQEYLEHN